MKTSKKYTVGSLYAGVGGICSGFKQAGANVIWANEYDKYACKTYRANFDHTLYEEDIWNLNPEDLESIDILTGGFPCQPFSVAGYRKGFEDERGNHFFRIIKYLQVLQPQAFLLENVKNLKSHDHGKTFKVILEALEANGYALDVSVLNTMDYGNIPQNRERVYMVGFKKDAGTGRSSIEYFSFPEKIRLTKKMSKSLENDGVAEKYYYRKNKYMYGELLKSMNRKDTVYQWRRQYVRENQSKVCPTLTANMGTGGHNVPIVLTDTGIRKLTPHECFNFQGFPPEFILPSNVSDAKLYKQAGNSVSVPVIKRIAEHMLMALDKVPLKLSSSKQIKLSLKV